MKNNLSKLTLAATFGLALTLTFGCSSDSDNGNNPPNINSGTEISSSSWNEGSLSSSDVGTDNPSSSSVFSHSPSNSSSSLPSSSGSSSSDNGSSSSSVITSSGSAHECEAIFNPSTHFCYNGDVYSKCNGVEYNPATHICQGTIASPAMCNGVQYNPLVQICKNNVIETPCGASNNFYNSSTDFCYDSNIYSKCNGMEYNPATHICQGTIANPARCNGIQYNPLEQLCSGNNVYDYGKCNGSNYNPLTQYCSNGIVKNYITYEGKTYKTVVIGTQTWMAENLNYATSGSKCGNGSSLSDANTTSCDIYGRLYNWEAAKLACHSGWHLPSDTEWNVLMKFVSPSCSDNSTCAGVGKKLKTTDWNGTDDYDFAALPGGYGLSDDRFAMSSSLGSWWSSGEYIRRIRRSNDDVEVSYYSNGTSNLYSIRCVKD